MNTRSRLFKSIAQILIGVMCGQPLLLVAADLRVDVTAGSSTQITQAGNGVPVVNIAKPNAKGLSHNKFTDYNVNKQGLILNNSTDKLTETQLGGIIIGNGHLQGKSAQLILNEVTGGQASQLQGYTEVAGKQAHVVVANPHGVTCDGCGFINTPRVTLTTGKPIIEQGKLSRFDVDGGQVEIAGEGLNASNISQFDLVTRSAKINAELYANDLNIITGRNTVDAENLATTAKIDRPSDKPSLAIDSSALGGMYAGAIRLVGTEAGVGVKLAGDMAASAGDIQIDAKGKLILSSAVVSRDFMSKAGDVELAGNIYAGGTMNVKTRNQLSVKQNLAAAGDISLQSAEVVNVGVVEAGVEADSRRNASADLRIVAEHLHNEGVLIGNRQLDIDVSHILDNRDGALSGKSLTRIKVGQLDNYQGRILADQQLQISGEILNNKNGMLQSQGSASLMISETLDNRKGNIHVGKNLSMQIDSLDNRQDGLINSQTFLSGSISRTDNRRGIIHGKQGMNLYAEQIDNRDQGLLSSGGTLMLDVDKIDSSNQGEISAAGDIHIRASELVQHDGQTISEGNVNLDLKNGVLDNQGGLVRAKGELSLSRLANLNNSGGELSSNKNINVIGQQLNNSKDGRIIASKHLMVSVDEVDNSAGGLLSGWQGLNLSGVSLNNSNQGTLSSREGELTIQLDGVLNNSSQGALVSKINQKVIAANLDNRADGIVSSEAELALQVAGQLDNRNHGLIGAAILDIQARQIINGQGGRIDSSGNVLLVGHELDSDDGRLSANGAMTLLLSGALRNNNGSQLVSGGPLRIKAKSVDNRGGQLVSQSLLDLFAISLINRASGTLAADENLSIELDGALDNSNGGLIYSQGADLAIKADELINDGGSLQANVKLHLDIGQALSNRGGRINSLTNDLVLQAGSLDNSSGGVLNSVLGWLRIHLVGLFDNRDGIAQSKRGVSIVSGQVDNSAGHLSTLEGDTRVVTGMFVNQGGGLYARNLLDVNADSFDNQDATADVGGKVAARAIDFSLNAELNNNHGLIEASESLLLRASNITNRRGVIRSLGQSDVNYLSTTIGALDNREGRIEMANHNLSFQLKGLLNTGGNLLHTGRGDLGLSTSEIMHAGGTLVTNGELDISTDRWSFEGSLQARKLNLSVSEFTLTADARLLAVESLNANGENWVNDGLISSDGSMRLTLNGSYTGMGDLISLDGFELAAANLDLEAEGSITSGNNTLITIDGALRNRGQITSSGDFTLRAATFSNYGTLGSAQVLSLYAPTLLNERGLVFSGRDMLLRSNYLTNLRGNFYSLGNLDIAANDANDWVSQLDNISGSLESAGDMRVLAHELNNHRENFSTELQRVSGHFDVYWDDYCKGKGCEFYFRSVENYEDVIVAGTNSPMALINSGGNFRFNGSVLNNQFSTVSAADDITITTDTLRNTGAGGGEQRHFNSGFYTRDRYSYNTIIDNKNIFNRYNNPQLLSYQPENLSVTDVLDSVSDLDSDGYRAGFFDTTSYIVPISGAVVASALIQAGGAVSINASQRINNSVVRANTSNAGEIGTHSISIVHLDRSNVPVITSQLPPELAQKQVNPIGLPSFSLPSGGNGLFRLSDRSGQNEFIRDAQIDGLQVQQLATVAGLQNHVRTSGEHKYLIETNPALVDLKTFLNSDYLLGNLGYSLNQTQKRLGDGLYEQQLIRESVLARTGQRYLAGLTSDEAMFRYLMDNALTSKETLNLSLGVTLSAEQVAALTHDIVWLEEHEVLGEKVLVPVLYLAQAKGRLAGNGALIQGRDLLLISGGELVNQGTLRATDNLISSTNNVANSGLVESSQRLQLQATDSIRNVQGGIIAGRDVSLLALTGDVINERSRTTFEISGGGDRLRNDIVSSATRIEAGDDLLLSAERDIQNIGSVIQAGSDARLEAGRNLNIVSQEEVDTYEYQRKREHGYDNSITQHGASLKAGGELVLSAQQDMVVIGSHVLAGGDISMTAGSDLIIASVADEQHQYAHRKQGKTKTTLQENSVVQLGSDIGSGDNIALHADNDLNIIASEVKAVNDVSLAAGQDVHILSATDESTSFYAKKSKGSFGRNKSTQQESYNSTNVASEIGAGNNLAVNTSITDTGGLSLEGGRNVTVIGSQLNVGLDLLVGAINDITILSGVEEHGSYSKKTKSGFLGFNKSGKSQLKTTATQVGSELSAANDVVLVAGNDLGVRASTVDAGNDVELRAGLLESTGDINLLSASNEAYSLSERYRKKTGLSASGGMVSVSSAKKAGQAAQSSTSVGSQVIAERDASLQAERDINIVGSGVSAGGNLLLDAGRDVQVIAADNENATSTWQRERRTGIAISSDRNGVTAFAGNDTKIDKRWDTQSTAAASLLETGEDLDIKAGRDIRQSGSDLAAGRDINLIAGQNIILDAVSEQRRQQQEKTHQLTGLNVSINHNFGNSMDAIKGAGRGDNALSQLSGVLKASDSVTQFVSGPTTSEHLGATRQQTTTVEDIQSYRESTLDAGRDINLLAGQDVEASGARLNSQRDINIAGQNITLDVARGYYAQNAEQTLSQSGINGSSTANSARVGISSSHSKQTETGRQDMSLPTQLQAGRDVNLESVLGLTLIGTQVQAQRDIQLSAGQDLSIRAAQNDSTYETRRKSGGGEVGLAVGGQDLLSVYASVDVGKGKIDRESAQQQEAYLYAGHHLKFNSGRDTLIAGAQIEGEKVRGRVGRDLLVASVADTGKVSGKEFDASLTVSVGLSGSASLSGSIGVGKTTGSADWIENQTRMTARDTLDIRTENHTQLDGAVIASNSGDLKLDTNTLGFSDFKGRDKESSWYVNTGGTYSLAGDSGNAESDFKGGTAAAKTGVVDRNQDNKDGSNQWNISGYNSEKDRQQIVRATIGEGEIIVRSDAETGVGSLQGLNRDTSKAYEVIKDNQETTELYVSSSSFAPVKEPKLTVEQWKQGIQGYGLNSAKAFLQLSLLKDRAATEAENNNLVAALTWAPSLLVNAMDSLNKPTAGVFPGVENHGGLATQVPALAVGDLMIYRAKGKLKLDEKTGQLVVEKGKPVLDGVPTFDSFDGFTEDEKAHIATNGIMNSQLEAMTNALMQGGMEDGQSFVLAYNPTHGLIGDLLESAFDSRFKGSVKSGTARNLDGLYQQASQAPIKELHIYGHSQGGLLTWVAIKGQDFSNIELVTVQLSGAPVDAVKFHDDVEATKAKETYSVYQTNRPEEKTILELPKTDAVADLPGLGGNAQYSDDQIGLTLGALFSLASLFDTKKSAHSNYGCVTCERTGWTETSRNVREIVINPTLIDIHGNHRKLNE